jgi:hypothetical protein
MHNHRGHPSEPLGLLCSDRDQTGVGTGSTQHGAVKGPWWSGRVLRVDGLAHDTGPRIDTCVWPGSVFTVVIICLVATIVAQKA